MHRFEIENSKMFSSGKGCTPSRWRTFLNFLSQNDFRMLACIKFQNACFLSINLHVNLELMYKFCYLGDMLNVDGDADTAVEVRM